MSVRPYRHRKTKEIIPHKWVIDTWPAGRKGKRSVRIFEGLETDARELELELRRMSRHLPKAHPKVADLLAEWLDEYRQDHRPETYRDALKSLKHWQPWFGNLLAAHVVPVVVEQYKAARLQEGVKRRTVNKELSYLSSFMRWAHERYNIPLPKIKKFSGRLTRPPKPRPLSIDQVNALVAAIEPHYRLPLLLMTDTGLRRSEALTLHRRDVDLEKNLLFVTGKGDKERIVPIITERLRIEIRQAMAADNGTEWLTINPKTKKPYLAIRKAIIRVADKAGIPQHVYHHLLRHSFGTNAVVAGVGMRALQEIMGHSTGQMTEIYTHLAAEHLRDQASKLDCYTQQAQNRSDAAEIKAIKDGKNN